MSLARVVAPCRSSLFRTPAAAAAISRTRGYATQKVDNIPLAAYDDGAPTSAVTVAIRAGSRYETSPGVANGLKHFLFKSNAKRSALRLVRESELYGGLLSTSISKEHLFLTTEFLRGDEDFFVEILGDVLTSSKFAIHEFNEEVLPASRSEYEQMAGNPSILGFDVLTQTAYRQRGLGASLYASPSSPITASSVSSYARGAFARDNIAVFGTGISQDKLSSLVSKSFAGVPGTSSGTLNAGPSTYFGGEQRVDYAPHHADSPKAYNGHFFLAFQGGTSPEFAVLRSLLGGESSVKWAKGLSPLAQAAAKVNGGHAEAFNLTFSDSGLIGAYLTAPTPTLPALAKEVANAFKSIASGVSSEDLQRAIAKAKFEAVSQLEKKEDGRAFVGASLLNKGSLITRDEIVPQLESVNAKGLSAAVQKMLKGKATTVAIGDVRQLPYADDIF